LWSYNTITNEWTWVSGPSSKEQPASYGEKGVPHSNNNPGARHRGCMWVDNNGVVWIFGGDGYSPDDFGLTGALNDLWKFENGEWTFVSGSEWIEDQTNFGNPPTPRVPRDDIYPGGREGCTCWTDDNGHFWLYGGTEYAGANIIWCGDTWRFDGTNWTFWGGPTEGGADPEYVSPKIFSFDHHPGGRHDAGVISSGSIAYLVGGHTSNGRSADIWKFDPSQGWAFWAGEYGQHEPIPGTIRVPSLENMIGSSIKPFVGLDTFDNLWIFGGNIALNGMFQNFELIIR
jgi:hypothetical protein